MDTENRVMIMSRDDAELLIYEDRFPESTAVISFIDPKERRLIGLDPVNYKGACDSVFLIEAEDIDRDSWELRGKDFEEFLPEAEEAARFIHENMKTGKTIICQCEYGESRSAGCAAAIREFFFGDGIKVFADFRYLPSQMIYNKMFRALKDTADS
ncbi:hypothetical protein [Ruminococcus sp.]|uniref:hypothetical protein n=1 Tax=Ruminococcus sp. TaxID=41978 RepID=UPI0025E0025B|nr:hypothetical protein [Ruminococcus sp.]MBQ8965537.1 hypothetical protein [Ruminococcus sp.]